MRGLDSGDGGARTQVGAVRGRGAGRGTRRGRRRDMREEPVRFRPDGALEPLPLHTRASPSSRGSFEKGSPYGAEFAINTTRIAAINEGALRRANEGTGTPTTPATVCKFRHPAAVTAGGTTSDAVQPDVWPLRRVRRVRAQQSSAYGRGSKSGPQASQSSSQPHNYSPGSSHHNNNYEPSKSMPNNSSQNSFQASNAQQRGYNSTSGQTNHRGNNTIQNSVLANSQQRIQPNPQRGHNSVSQRITTSPQTNSQGRQHKGPPNKGAVHASEAPNGSPHLRGRGRRKWRGRPQTAPLRQSYGELVTCRVVAPSTAPPARAASPASERVDCAVCCEPLDWGERHRKLCACGFDVCLLCRNRLDTDSGCPACRRPLFLPQLPEDWSQRILNLTKRSRANSGSE